MVPCSRTPAISQYPALPLIKLQLGAKDNIKRYHQFPNRITLMHGHNRLYGIAFTDAERAPLSDLFNIYLAQIAHHP